MQPMPHQPAAHGNCRECHPCRSAPACSTASCAARFMPASSAEGMMPCGRFLQISALQRARAPAMEQALEGILREAEVSDELIMIMRVQGVTKKAIFVSLDTTVECFGDACSQGLRVDADSGFTHRLNSQNLSHPVRPLERKQEPNKVSTRYRRPTANPWSCSQPIGWG